MTCPSYEVIILKLTAFKIKRYIFWTLSTSESINNGAFKSFRIIFYPYEKSIVTWVTNCQVNGDAFTLMKLWNQISVLTLGQNLIEKLFTGAWSRFSSTKS